MSRQTDSDDEKQSNDAANTSEAARALGRLGGAKGGKARAAKLTPDQRSEIARKAVQTRWAKVRTERQVGSQEIVGTQPEPSLEPEVLPTGDLPVAKYKGVLDLMGAEIPCYVLDNGQRVIGRTAATEALTGIKGGGGLEKYLEVRSLKPFINLDLVLEGMIPFRLPEVEGLETAVKGITTDLQIEIWRGFVAALEASNRPEYEPKLTGRQREMAVKASMLVAACAKVGLDALVDEATGYQYERARDALEVKLRAYLEKEMRKWEKTFPDELWLEFARLTNWKGTVTQRPKYWGKLVMELIYEYLDPDVAQWLRENAPKPRHGQNYHQWLSSQYGLKKLVEHIWKVIGIASQCDDGAIEDLKGRMRALHGKGHIQRLLPYMMKNY
jgi:P63C domain